MLLLKRKLGEFICIGDNVEVVVTSIDIDQDGNKFVHLGIAAPKSVSVDRKEVRERRLNKIGRLVNGIPKTP